MPNHRTSTPHSVGKSPKSPKDRRQQSARSRRHQANVDRIWQQLSPDALSAICQMPEEDFAETFGMETHEVDQPAPSDFYAFKDNGSNILAVAHLDTVSKPNARMCNFLHTAGGWVVYSRALDDRLGAFVILDLLPKLGIRFDILLTVGEELGESTAAFFEPSKEYDWIIEFDRGGTDVVMYQYEDEESADLVHDSGAIVGDGAFSDISYMERLGLKAFNWGVGYQDYHSARSHAFLDDTVMMVAHFLEFYRVNKDVRLPHDAAVTDYDHSGERGSVSDLTGLFGEDQEFRNWWNSLRNEERSELSQHP